MIAYWACKDIGNFGDLITPYILNKLGYDVQFVDNKQKQNHVFLSGSILREATHRTTVIGSGFSVRDQTTNYPTIRMVRGPITDDMLVEQGYDRIGVYGDPGLILPKLYYPKIEKRHKVGVIPHYIDDHINVLNEYLKINVLLNTETVIDQILSCEMVVSSSLHGIIVAHAYSIPCLWVEFSNNIVGDGMKYKDYFLSTGIVPYSPIDCRNNIPNDIEDRIPMEIGSIDIDEVYDNICTFLGEFEQQQQ